MKTSKKYLHKSTNIIVNAIQYLGDKNKFYICEFLKGQKFNVDFATHTKPEMSVFVGEDTALSLAESSWLVKDEQGRFAVSSNANFKSQYKATR